MKNIVKIFLILSFISFAALLTSCYKTMSEAEFQAFINSKEHDSDLVGYWQSVDKLSSILYYDDSEYKVFHGEIDEQTQEISISKKGYVIYHWYTENGVLTNIDKAEHTHAEIRHEYNYLLSDDKQQLTIVHSETYSKVFNRIVLPEKDDSSNSDEK